MFFNIGLRFLQNNGENADPKLGRHLSTMGYDRMTRNDAKKESEWNIRIGSQRNSEIDHAKVCNRFFNTVFRVQESDGRCNRPCGYAQVEELWIDYSMIRELWGWEMSTKHISILQNTFTLLDIKFWFEYAQTRLFVARLKGKKSASPSSAFCVRASFIPYRSRRKHQIVYQINMPVIKIYFPNYLWWGQEHYKDKTTVLSYSG